MRRSSISSWAKLKIRLSQEDTRNRLVSCEFKSRLGFPLAAENPARGTKLLFSLRSLSRQFASYVKK
jgi:hypothetical protein